MSLVELILSQKVIPLTVGLALLLILMAFVLTVVPRIRHARKVAAQQRAERARLVEQELAKDDVPRPAGPAAVPTTPEAAASGGAAAKAAAPLLGATPAAAPSTEEAVSSAMQDILSSVFADESNSERQAALLRGLPDVDIAHLLTLSQQVSAQLRGETAIRMMESGDPV